MREYRLLHPSQNRPKLTETPHRFTSYSGIHYVVLSAGQWAQKTTAMKKTSKKNLARAQSGLSLVSLVGRALGPQLCGAGRARARSTPAYKGNSKFSRVTFKTIKTKNLYLIASCNCAKAGPNPCRYCKVMITQSLGRKMQKSRKGNRLENYENTNFSETIHFQDQQIAEKQGKLSGLEISRPADRLHIALI